MPRNVTLYISDELDEKMKQFGEVNWSEIARQSIINYIEGRVAEAIVKNEVPENVLKEFWYYVESLRQFMGNNDVYSIAYMHNDFNIDVTQREKTQFREIFRTVQEDYAELRRSLELFEKKNTMTEFKPVFIRLLRLFGRYSTMVTDFALLVKEKTKKIELIAQTPGSRAQSEYLDETYSAFRERYNDLVLGFVRFTFITKNFHEQNLDDYYVFRLLAPRLVDFRLSASKETV